MAAEDGKDVSTSKRLPPALIHGPVTLCNSFEVSVHKVPRLFKHDMQVVLPKLDMDDMLIVPTAQRSAMDLVNWGPETAREKDLLLERFVAWAQLVCTRLESQGYWCDYVDPCSGLPVRGSGGAAVYPEVDAFETLLRWKTSSAGGCRVLLHPSWGSAVYPASLFTKAPLPALVPAMEEAAASMPIITEPSADAAAVGARDVCLG